MNWLKYLVITVFYHGNYVFLQSFLLYSKCRMSWEPSKPLATLLDTFSTQDSKLRSYFWRIQDTIFFFDLDAWKLFHKLSQLISIFISSRQIMLSFLFISNLCLKLYCGVIVYFMNLLNFWEPWLITMKPIRVAQLKFLIEVAKSLPCRLSQFSFSKLRQPTGQRLRIVRTQETKISIGQILFLYYEPVSSNLN